MKKIYQVQGSRMRVVVYHSSEVCKRGYYIRRWDTFDSSNLEFIGDDYSQAIDTANKTVASDEKWRFDFDNALGIDTGHGLVTVEFHMFGRIEFEEFSACRFIDKVLP